MSVRGVYLAGLLRRIGWRKGGIALLVALLFGGVGSRFVQAQLAPNMLQLADLVRQLGPELPRLLGMEQPQSYLVLVQNNHELRGTGGFISAVGRLTLDRGKVTDLDFVDSYALYRSDGLYPPPP
ncbi:MAG: DUF4012 domain-containing protein, partial [Caldilinea sp.]